MVILIKNGLVYDGAGGAPAKTDVLIQNKKIARLGDSLRKDSNFTVIDASGLAVTPGFVDINFNAGGSDGILASPRQENSVAKGVTTVIGGGGGVSLAPVLGDSLAFVKEWGFVRTSNLHWRSVREFLEVLERRGVGVNFGTLVGYPVIRRFFTGDVLRDLSAREVRSAKHAAARAQGDGAFGLSIDLSAPYARGIPTREIFELAREIAKTNRLLAVHLRNDGAGLIEALQEILELGEAAKSNIEVNHLEPLREFRVFYEKALGMIERGTARSHIGFDVYPQPVAVISVHSLLPPWLATGSLSETESALRQKGVKERVLKHLRSAETGELTIAEVPANLKFLVGKPLGDFAKNAGLSGPRAIFELMLLTGLKAKLLSAGVDKKIFGDFLKSQRAVVSLDSNRSADGRMNGGDLLASVEKSGELPPEKVIAKMTGLIAAKYGLSGRGFIREGFWADVAVWEDWKPRVVLVNGSVVLENGVYGGKMAGAVLRAS